MLIDVAPEIIKVAIRFATTSAETWIVTGLPVGLMKLIDMIKSLFKFGSRVRVELTHRTPV